MNEIDPLYKNLIGRDQELKELLEAFQESKHILILGGNGVGKTTLVESFAQEITKTSPHRKFVFCSADKGFKDVCLSLLDQLGDLGYLEKVPEPLRKSLSSKGNPAQLFSKQSVTILKNIVLANAQGRGLVFVFDRLPKLKRKFYLFLENLKDCARLVIIPQNGTKNEMGRLWMVLWGFHQINLKPLKTHDMKRLLIGWIAEHPGLGGDNSVWIDEMVRAAHGNPGILRALTDEVVKQGDCHGAPKNVHLADIDRKITAFIKGSHGAVKPSRERVTS
jgi:energy-coupling factor transporter ATP-binding protein EcfA2